MCSHRRACLVLVVACLGMINTGQVRSVGQRTLALLTPNEAVQLRLAEGEWQPPPRTRAPSLGPRIVIERPPIKQAADGPIIDTVSPTDIMILFEENHAPVDMNSLQIEAKKWLFSLSLTPRLKPYIQGASLRAKSVQIPEGLFVIQIEIADVAGRKPSGLIA
jgi:hypothetical protein